MKYLYKMLEEDMVEALTRQRANYFQYKKETLVKYERKKYKNVYFFLEFYNNTIC